MPIAQHLDPDHVTGALAVDVLGQGGGPAHDGAVETDDDVTPLEACLVGRRIRHDAGDACASFGMLPVEENISAP